MPIGFSVSDLSAESLSLISILFLLMVLATIYAAAELYKKYKCSSRVEAGVLFKPHPMSISEIFKQSWQIFRQHFTLIVSIVLIVWLPIGLLEACSDTPVFAGTQWRAGDVWGSIFGPIGTAAIIVVAYSSMSDKPVTLKDSFSVGISSWIPMIITGFAAGLVVGVGFLLLFLPGIYLFFRFALAYPAVVLEGLDGNSALKRSWAITQHYLGSVFLVIVACRLIDLISDQAFSPLVLSDDALAHLGFRCLSELILAFEMIALTTIYMAFAGSTTEFKGSLDRVALGGKHPFGDLQEKFKGEGDVPTRP